jgi:hypothetical protein
MTCSNLAHQSCVRQTDHSPRIGDRGSATKIPYTKLGPRANTTLHRPYSGIQRLPTRVGENRRHPVGARGGVVRRGVQVTTDLTLKEAIQGV